MKITTRDHVSDRTADGRVYSAGEGTVTLVDDSDTGMVDLMRSLAARGLVDIEEDESPAAPDDEPPADTVAKIDKPARKSTTAKVASDE